MSTYFLIRPQPIDGEFGIGHLLRVSEENEAGSVKRVRHCFPPAFIEGRKRAMGTGPVSRGPITSLPGRASLDPGGIGAIFWNTRRPRYCPSCLTEAPYWRADWGLALIVVCTRHKITLLDGCAKCHRPLRWDRPNLLFCNCGADLRQASTDISEIAASEMLGELDQASAAALHASMPGGAERLVGALRCVWLLGAYGLAEVSKPRKLADMHDCAKAKRVVERAVAVMQDWPMNYYELLDSIAARASGKRRTGLVTEFGEFYRAIFSKQNNSAYTRLRDGFQRYVVERWSGQIARRNRRIFNEVGAERRWVPATQAASDLGWRAPRVRRAIESGALRGRVSLLPSGRTLSVVHRDSVNEMKEMLANSLDQVAACKQLGVGKKRLRSLVEEGRLTPFLGPSVDGSSVWRFRAEDVARLTREC